MHYLVTVALEYAAEHGLPDGGDPTDPVAVLRDEPGTEAHLDAASGRHYVITTANPDGRLPPAEPLEPIRRRHLAARRTDPHGQAGRDYRAQPRVQLAGEEQKFTLHLDHDPVAAHAPPRAECLRRAADSALPGYACLGPDGVRREPNAPEADDPIGEAELRDAFHAQVNAAPDALPGDTLLVAVDIHS